MFIILCDIYYILHYILMISCDNYYLLRYIYDII